MSEMGQNRKYSLRADDVRSTPESGLKSDIGPCPKSANSGHRCRDASLSRAERLFLLPAASLAAGDASRNFLEFVQIQLCVAGFVLPRLGAHGVLNRLIMAILAQRAGEEKSGLSGGMRPQDGFGMSSREIKIVSFASQQCFTTGSRRNSCAAPSATLMELASSTVCRGLQMSVSGQQRT